MKTSAVIIKDMIKIKKFLLTLFRSEGILQSANSQSLNNEEFRSVCMLHWQFISN